MIVMVSHKMNSINPFHSLPASNCFILGSEESKQQGLTQNAVSSAIC